MFRIVADEKLTPVIDLFRIEAPAIAKKAKAGQFVIVRVDEAGERIPLTLADWDAGEGTVTVVAMEVGTSTRKLGLLKAGDSIQNLVGPLGLPSDIEKFGTVICVGGGVHRQIPGRQGPDRRGPGARRGNGTLVRRGAGLLR